MPDTTLGLPARPRSLGEPSATARGGHPPDIERWLNEGVESLSERWIEEILSRDDDPPAERIRIVHRFARLIVRLLPMMLGQHRVQLRPIWLRTAELYGAVAVKRGLAAGEAIEEMHVLRELVIRKLYLEAPMDGSTAWPMREILRLNRALDQAVTQASIGHTDTLFFDFFGPSGGRAILDGEDSLAEVERQLEGIAAEVREHFDVTLADPGDEH